MYLSDLLTPNKGKFHQLCFVSPQFAITTRLYHVLSTQMPVLPMVSANPEVFPSCRTFYPTTASSYNMTCHSALRQEDRPFSVGYVGFRSFISTNRPRPSNLFGTSCNQYRYRNIDLLQHSRPGLSPLSSQA